MVASAECDRQYANQTDKVLEEDDLDRVELASKEPDKGAGDSKEKAGQ